VFGAAVLVALALSAVIAGAIAQPLVREVAREKELDARRREFIAHASHELKTPISIISSHAEGLLDDVVSGGERRGFEQVIFDETQRMAYLVGEMLEISRLQDARVALRRTEVQLEALVEQALHRFERRIEAKQIKVTLENRKTAALQADEAQIDLVLDNLVSNAIYHTPAGGRVRVALAEAPGSVRFEIENQGEPIPEAMLGHIWDSFFRADQARQREDGRYGLGLSIVKLGVETHGGRVGVRNTANGVLFFFELPAQ
jgi:signal transduction histidine kinase